MKLIRSKGIDIIYSEHEQKLDQPHQKEKHKLSEMRLKDEYEEIERMKREMENLKDEEARLKMRIEKDRLNRDLDLQRQKVRSLRGKYSLQKHDLDPFRAAKIKIRLHRTCNLILGICLAKLVRHQSK